jgi:hypothetical protein
VQGGQSVTLTAVVTNDQSNAGVTWSVTGGTLSNQTATTATYTAPTATATAQSITVTAKSKADTTKSGSVTLTVPAAVQTGTISGDISAWGTCSYTVPAPPTTVSINTTPVQTTTTDSTGSFSFANVPYGSYTITPSISGVSAIFSPSTQSVTLGSSSAQANFYAEFDYTISGTVSYAGKQTGPIYLTLIQYYDTGYSINALAYPEDIGTSIAAPGTFTIHGVQPGTCALQAWMDNVGVGVTNATNPTGLVTNVKVSDASLTGVNVTLTDPAPITLSATPPLTSVQPFSQGARVTYEPIGLYGGYGNPVRNNNAGYIEDLVSFYTLQWSTDSTFATIAGSKTFPSVGLNTLSTWLVDGLTDGTSYYFRANGTAGSSTSSWSQVYGPVTIGAAAGTSTVSGNITFSGTPTGPLYVVFDDYDTVVIANPVSPQPYSILLTNGSNNSFYAFIDQNNDGILDAGDIASAASPEFTINGDTTEDLTLFSGNSNVSLTTASDQTYDYQSGYVPSQGYTLSLSVKPGIKEPVAVTLLSGPNVMAPVDIGQNGLDGSPTTPFGVTTISLLGGTPKAGDAYGLQITYSDGSSETVTKTLSGVLGFFGANPSPVGIGTDLKPTFSWTDPPNAANYTYFFDVTEQGGNMEGWQIPKPSLNPTGFSSTITSIPWGVDPTGSGSVDEMSTLQNQIDSMWQVKAVDSNSNSSTMYVYYWPGDPFVSLPNPNPSTLGPATVGQSYTGTIIATGGTASYTFTVFGLSDGLSSSASGETLTISGTPTAAATVAFQVSVKDSTGSFGVTYGPVPYTISVTP